MRGGLIAVLLALGVLTLSVAIRYRLHDRTPAQEGESWTVSDPDSLYHARRVERALDAGGLPAPSDPALNHPEGARIPWPPYYDLLAAWAIEPGLSDSPSTRRGQIERGVAWLPFVFGALTSLLAFLAARSLAGPAAGVGAGVLHALCLGSVAYSRIGNGDHHAFYSCVAGVVLAGLAAALRGERLRERRWQGAGAALGALVGFTIGAWVGALILAVVVDAVFALLLVAHARRPRAGLAEFGLAYHVAALLVLVPGVLQSPWKDEFPWMVVNLSWLHLAYFAAGACVFVPLLFAREGGTLRRRHPWLVGLALAGLAGLSFALDAGPAAGVREGFAWVSRADRFMSGIAESRPLLGAGAQAGELFTFLGYGVLLLPFAWVGLVVVGWRRRSAELLPWIVCLPPFALQAAGQVRFADALALPAAVALAWAAVTAVRALRPSASALWLVPLLAALAVAANPGTLEQLSAPTDGPRPDWRRERARRALCTWIRERTPDTGEAVLANWNLGHEIEWAAERPTIATNFGSYVGEEGFLTPARVFLATDLAESEALLEARGARHLLLSCNLPGALDGWLRAGPGDWRARFTATGRDGAVQLRPEWYRTLAARLLNGGFPRVAAGAEREDSVEFLRLLHASPTVIRRSAISDWAGPTPYGWVWERVAGARVTLTAEPGARCAVELRVAYANADGGVLQELTYLRTGVADEAGSCELRVPYATGTPNGDGRVLAASWRAGEASGPLIVAELDVAEGRRVDVRR